MEKAGTFLGRVARRMNQPNAALAWLKASWPSVAGHAIAEHSRPTACEAGRLQVVVDATEWGNQVESLKGVLCNKVNSAWGRVLVKEIEIVAQKSNSSHTSVESDIHHTPFIRRRAV
ncbi:MAG TPA: DUF721 domain-containing protein [Candidatus Acidoferrales bacterium]|nr:DUF721 domain-containing protein [Candidatus Acidoferrales bacterium]